VSAQHTPGPWRLVVTVPEDNPNHHAAWGKVERPHACSIEASLADARLIASAPDLLELARFVAKHFENTDAPLGEHARNLIRKAEGGAS
jgi:hypothetical protein